MKSKNFLFNFKRQFFNLKLKLNQINPKQETIKSSQIANEKSNDKFTFPSKSKLYSSVTINKMNGLNKSIDGNYTACVEPIVINKNQEVLLFFHRMNVSTTFILSLRYTLPMSALIYLIKTNPFYITYPVMLPLMSITFFIYSCYLFGFMRRLKNVVNEIWLDNSGKEIKIIYRNMRYRKFRENETEDIMLVNSMISPRIDNKIPLRGNLFPENFPFDEQTIYDSNFFWTKYYLSNRNYFLIPKRSVYCNYEILVNAFKGKSIDFKHTEAYQINFEGNKRKDVLFALKEINQYKKEKLFKS